MCVVYSPYIVKKKYTIVKSVDDEKVIIDIC